MKSIAVFFIFCFCNLTNSAQTVNTENNTAEIRKLMNDWMIAVKEKDAKALNRIVAPEFKLDGIKSFDKAALTRQVWMKNTLENLKVDSVHYYKMKVDVINNIAVVQSTFYWSGSFFNQPFVDSSSILVDTWMKRKQGWQVVSRIRVD